MFTYTSVRPGDGVPVTHQHQTTLTQVLAGRSESQALALAAEMLHSLIRDRGAIRAEFYDVDAGLRLTVEREEHAFDHPIDIAFGGPTEEVVLDRHGRRA